MGTSNQSSKHSKPKQYIQGWVEFYKLKFKVTPDVLIPRPETELLVDEVIRFADHPLTILDIGTGCGNISIALAKNLNGHPGGVRIIATDISAKALAVAEQNAKFHGVQDKIEFVQSDLLDDISGNIDIIVSNLPYIPSARIPYLDSSVKDHEPLIALDGGPDGFDLYRKLFAQIKENHLNPGLLICEIDYTHGQLAVNESQKYFPKAQIKVKHDLAKKQRILIIKFTR